MELSHSGRHSSLKIRAVGILRGQNIDQNVGVVTDAAGVDMMVHHQRRRAVPSDRWKVEKAGAAKI